MTYRSAIRMAGALSVLLASPVLLGAVGPRQNFEQRVLGAHNRERSSLGVGTLEWSDDLASAARQWARHLAATGKFEHSPETPQSADQGENLWAGTVGYYQPETMVGLWIEEKQHYKPGVFPNNSRTGSVEDVGHYTQLIWADTRQVGCALARGAVEDVLVCRYSSAGNIVGKLPV